MSYSIDQQFILKYTLLVREVLADEARFVARNDQKLKNIHNYLFTKNVSTPFAEIPELDRQVFRKYFYEREGTGGPREEVPFSDSTAEQAAFFDSFRLQVKNCTYNFERMDFLRPSFTDDKTPEPTFNEYQQNLLLKGVIFPLLHGLEQRQIAGLEGGGQSAAAETEQEKEAAGNPYRGLGDKMLVQGTSGQYDTVLSYAQLEAIAGQEDLLRKQGHSPLEVVKRLREFIEKTYPGLNVYLTEDGKIVPFLRGAGVSATAMPVAAGGIGFAEALAEMKVRQGRTLQYEALLASRNTLGLTPWSFQVVDSAGVVSAMEGLSMGLDQEGQGNRIVGFLADQQGVGTKFVADTGEYRAGGSTRLHFSIYQSPDKDLPSNPRIKLEQPELPRLQMPLLALYREMQEAGQYRTVPGRPVRETPPGAPRPLEAAGLSGEGEPETVPLGPEPPAELGLITSTPTGRHGGEVEGPSTVTFTLPGARAVSPMEQSALHGQTPRIVPRAGGEEPAVSARPETAGLAEGELPPAPRPKRPAPEQEGVGGLGIPAAPVTGRPGRRAAIVAAATAAPLVGILGSALAKILMS